MKKVGVLTHYFNSCNYGGLLQAYALIKYLNDNGYKAEQISFDIMENSENITIEKNNSFINAKKMIAKKMRIIKNYLHKAHRKIAGRCKACTDFRESIPHTREIYSNRNIDQLANAYDAFIVGSDQVWNPRAFSPVFFLDFVKDRKVKKISYAPSVSNNLEKHEVKEKYKMLLTDFNQISVREKEDVKLLQGITKKKVSWVVDPVFLISENEWKSKTFKIAEERYIFCYFFGDDEIIRTKATVLARENKLKIYTIPYLTDEYRKCDKLFGDIRTSNVSPETFISLINNAAYVLTDSFHAVAFSIIFNKSFVAFARVDYPLMGKRIRNITELFDCQNRFFEDLGNSSLENIVVALNSNSRYSRNEYRDIESISKEFLANI